MDVRFLVVLGLLGSHGALLAGCQGETVQSTTDGGTADTGSCEVANNLVLNGSFENAAGEAIANWPTAFKSINGGAYSCARYAEWRTTQPFDRANQDIFPTEMAPVGATYELAVYAKSLDGNTAPFSLYLEGASNDYSDRVTTAIRVDGWTRVSALFTLTKPTARITMAVRSSTELRVLGLDMMTLIRK